ALGAGDYYIDYQNIYTNLGVNSIRSLFVSSAEIFMTEGWMDKAGEMLDKSVEVMKHYPLDAIPVGTISNDYAVIQTVQDYYLLGEKEKARDLAIELAKNLVNDCNFYSCFRNAGADEYEFAVKFIYILAKVVDQNDTREVSDHFLSIVQQLNIDDD
ncbi:MAG: hypothetical protein MJY42_03230, partial [Bacteroidales bacterium]|nr:hypothetical protein [Bacteroidales bacterium]